MEHRVGGEKIYHLIKRKVLLETSGFLQGNYSHYDLAKKPFAVREHKQEQI